MSALFSLKGKVALITGATNGIGLGMAKGLASADIDQIILTYRSEKPLEEAIKVLQEVNPNVKFASIQVDLSAADEDATVKKIFEESYAKSSTGNIDILINNAGISARYALESFPQEEFDQVLKVNLSIPVKLTKAIGTKMLETKTEGKIVFTASLMSFQGGLNTTAYAITKGGINQFMKGLSNEWSSKGIRVNAIAPGYIQTKLTDSMDADRKATVLPRIPIGRWGNIDDFMGPIVFLTSDASKYVTGETLLVDGGWMAR
ncbi:L-rhamnose-1-dehydrogenase [[Candida] railenensis]|uniref:L-rhamnose-1-dehydrogenase n=1 Tax=[Candida] railenensis TaxID=45579 RepID=A0A9P0QK49_9ASCO|nr:L-rhamnose-1-dehydrogenase [[Candida] railenensis]